MRRLDRKNADDVFNQMQKMFEEFQNKGMDLATEFTGELSGNMPVDVREEDGDLVISADLPGVQKEDINITADGQEVRITAESSEELKEENEKYLRKERRRRSFSRTVRWPKEVDEDTVSAEYSDGVLEIRAEKQEEDGNRIEVE